MTSAGRGAKSSVKSDHGLSLAVRWDLLAATFAAHLLDLDVGLNPALWRIAFSRGCAPEETALTTVCVTNLSQRRLRLVSEPLDS